MMYPLLFVGFISLVLFVLYRILRLAFRLFRRLVVNRRSDGRDRVTFPEDAFRTGPNPSSGSYSKEYVPSYSIKKSEFSRIANKTAFRHPRVENVIVNDNEVAIDIKSQSGLTCYRATLTFSTSGSSIGEYSVQSDNSDTMIPTRIGDKIRSEIRRSVGLCGA